MIIEQFVRRKREREKEDIEQLDECLTYYACITSPAFVSFFSCRDYRSV